jgi:hypothetical protein
LNLKVAVPLLELIVAWPIVVFGGCGGGLAVKVAVTD